ncbi:MAG: LON peptidase substrate-binding domain-containing protein, partial [Deltaproteobacteria bacterium]|nr:LON peptidase substrate-binding domain-containing protein [Deltaproteobacteria bacterium]
MPNPLSEEADRHRAKEQPEHFELPVLPTRDLVLFPYMQAPLLVGRELSRRAVEQAEATADKLVLVCLQRQASDDHPRQPAAFWEIGTVATIVRSVPLQDGRLKVWVQGLQRAELLGISDHEGGLLASVGLRSDSEDLARLTPVLVPVSAALLAAQVETAALQRQAREDVERLLREGKLRSQDLLPLLAECDEREPGRFAD